MSAVVTVSVVVHFIWNDPHVHGYYTPSCMLLDSGRNDIAANRKQKWFAIEQSHSHQQKKYSKYNSIYRFHSQNSTNTEKKTFRTQEIHLSKWRIRNNDRAKNWLSNDWASGSFKRDTRRHFHLIVQFEDYLVLILNCTFDAVINWWIYHRNTLQCW